MTFNHDPHYLEVQPEKLIELNQEVGPEVFGGPCGHWRIELVFVSSGFIKIFHNLLDYLLFIQVAATRKDNPLLCARTDNAEIV